MKTWVQYSHSHILSKPQERYTKRKSHIVCIKKNVILLLKVLFQMFFLWSVWQSRCWTIMGYVFWDFHENEMEHLKGLILMNLTNFSTDCCVFIGQYCFKHSWHVSGLSGLIRTFDFTILCFCCRSTESITAYRSVSSIYVSCLKTHAHYLDI